jgi:hypothetical protein
MRTACALALGVLGAPHGAGAALPGEDSAGEETYLRYVHPTIREPFPDLLHLEVPAELEDRESAALGLVDVTKGPFRADPSGKRDSTSALQAAVTFARDHQMVSFFPPGTYRLSDTLECVQQLYRRANGRVFGANRFPSLLVGSRAGPARPRLLLAPNAPGFGDPAHPKIFVRFWSRGYLNPTTADRVSDGLGPEVEQPNIGMNQMLVNLDIAIGEGNPGAIALRHQAAEGSAIEDSTIDATHGLTGIQGGIGSGGSSAGVTVIGGRVGLDFTGYLSGTQPTPVITGFTLIGQTEAALRSTSRQTLVAVGLRIVSDRSAGPLIQVGGSGSGLRVNQGELTLVDSAIEFTGAALREPGRVVVSSDRGVYLDNVYLRGATKAVVDPAKVEDPAQKAELEGELGGDPGGWVRIVRYARPSRPLRDQGREYRYPVYVDGRSVERVCEVLPGEPPPADLQARHLWSPRFPSFESPGAVNAKAPPYDAKGDGRADDTEALQRAIDENEVVFLPKGCYRLTRTLELKPRTKLIGVGQHLSLLVATREGAFADPRSVAPLLRTADAAQADTALGFLGLYTAGELPGVQALHWRSGGSSVFRAVEIRVATAGAPLVRISGHGGGSWYNFRASRSPEGKPDYRHLLVDGARGPLRFYELSPQHATSAFAAEIRGSRHVSIFGTKYEGNRPILLVRDSDHVRLFGHGGNAKGLPGGTLFRFEGTPNLLFANGVDGPTKIGTRSLSHPEGSTDPRAWHMLIERLEDGTDFALPALERPVLYLRGRPEAGAEGR